MIAMNAAIVLKWLKGNVLNEFIPFQSIQPKPKGFIVLFGTEIHEIADVVDNAFEENTG